MTADSLVKYLPSGKLFGLTWANYYEKFLIKEKGSYNLIGTS
jgi:hypothetical protein